MTFFDHDENEKKILKRYVVAEMSEDLINVSDLETSNSSVIQVPRRMLDVSWQERKRSSGFDFPDDVKARAYGMAVVLHQRC